MSKGMMKYPGFFMKKLFRGFRLFHDYVQAHSSLIIRNVAIIILIFIVIVLIVSLFVFWLARKGPPEVAVPKVTGKDLIDGLLIIQKKKLHAVIDPRYFSDHEKNIIVEQDPGPGSIVREGKDIRLIVSKGPIVSIVEDYSGKTINFVRNRLQEIFTFQGKSIKIGNITYVTSDQPQGTIVGQFPPPNTPITNVEKVDLIVSRGKEAQVFQLGNYMGENLNDVMQVLALRGILVHIVPEDTADPSLNGIILSQDPPEGTVVARNGTVTFYVGYLPSEMEKDKLYARVLNFDVPRDLTGATVRIVVKDRIGEREIYNSRNVGGDTLSIPFKSYSNTTVYIYINDGIYEVRRIE